MPRKSQALAAKATSTDIALIDDQLANDVALLRNQINAPTGTKLKLATSGDFSTPDGLDLGNEIQIVVIDFISRNFYYSGPYNPNNITPPDCYAIGKDKTAMAPGDDAPDPQHANCATCPLNQFGSGNNGKSKACQNRYWLACLLIDPENPEAHNDPTAPVYVLDLSPSNLRSFEGFATAVARNLNGPPIKAIATVTGKNVGTYASVTFAPPVANPDYAQHVARRAEAADILQRRPDFSAVAQLAAPRGNARQPARRQAGARR